MEKYQKLPYNFFWYRPCYFLTLFKGKACKNPPALTTCLMCIFFSRLVRLLSIDGLMKSEAIVLVSVLPLNSQDNLEYINVLPFRIILKIFALNMLGFQRFWFGIKLVHWLEMSYFCYKTINSYRAALDELQNFLSKNVTLLRYLYRFFCFGKIEKLRYGTSV